MRIPDFRRAYEPDGMLPEEFDTFGPTARTLRGFIAACYQLAAAFATSCCPTRTTPEVPREYFIQAGWPSRFRLRGSGAIGSAIAQALADAGARVAVGDWSADRAEAAAAKISATGAEAMAAPADITKEAEAERAITATVARFGQLDIVVNAVGGGAGKVLYSAEDYPRDAWDWIMDLNLRSTLVATQAAVKPMI